MMDVYTYDPAAAIHVGGDVQRQHGDARSWTRFSAGLPLSLAGRTIKVGFQATRDMSKNTNFFIDSVSLDVVACTP